MAFGTIKNVRKVFPVGELGSRATEPVVALDDASFAQHLPAGSTGTATIFTDHVKVSHLIRRVLLRQIAILNYVNPF